MFGCQTVPCSVKILLCFIQPTFGLSSHWNLSFILPIIYICLSQINFLEEIIFAIMSIDKNHAVNHKKARSQIDSSLYRAVLTKTAQSTGLLPYYFLIHLCNFLYIDSWLYLSASRRYPLWPMVATGPQSRYPPNLVQVQTTSIAGILT